MGFIYKLTSPSGKSYIGQTIRPIKERFEEHQYQNSYCVAICNAIQKYGWDNIDKDWYECPDEDLNFDEELLVREMGTLAPGGYNLREGGGATGKMSEGTKQKMSDVRIGENNHMYGKKHTKETKQKISKAMSGKTLSDEHKQKLSEAMSGNTLSEEIKKKISEAHSGKMLSDEHKQKISKAMSGEKNTMSKKVYQYTIGGTYVDKFASSGEAAQTLGKSSGSSIRRCVRGKLKTAYGFKWSYTEL